MMNGGVLIIVIPRLTMSTIGIMSIVSTVVVAVAATVMATTNTKQNNNIMFDNFWLRII